MSTQTQHLGLIKDSPSDFYNLDRINGNLDVIDGAVAALSPTTGALVIPTTGWEAHAAGGYKKYVAVEGVSPAFWVDLVVDKLHQTIAQTAEINPTVEEVDGGIILYAAHIPTAAISVEYRSQRR